MSFAFGNLQSAMRNMVASRPAAMSVALNTGWLALEKVARIVLALTVGAWLARHLGPSQFGALAYALALVLMLQGIANLSADGIVVRDLARQPEHAADVLGTALRLRVLSGVVCWLVAVSVTWLIDRSDTMALVLVLVAGSSLLFQPAEVIDLWFQSQSQNKRTVGAKFAAHVTSNGLRVVFILAGAPLWAFAALAGAEALLIALALLIAYRRFPTARSWQFDVSVAKALFAQAWPFMLSSLAGAAYLRADQIIIKERLGTHALGLYATATQLTQVWSFLPIVLVTSLAPMISRLHAEDHARYERTIVQIFRAFFLAGLALGIATMIASGPLVHLLFGPAYAAAAAVLAVHAFTLVFVFLGTAHNLWLYNSGRPAVRLAGTLVGGTVSAVANWWLLPRYGLVASAWTAVAAQAIVTFFINALLAPRSFALQIHAMTFMKLPSVSQPQHAP